MHARRLLSLLAPSFVAAVIVAGCASQFPAPDPRTDWGHWRLGHRNDPAFLEANRFTVTFAGGAPNFERVTREEFDAEVARAKEEVKRLQDAGYLVLRYMTSSVHGTTATPEDEPTSDRLDLYEFYHNGSWDDFADYVGPRPDAENDPSTWLMVRADGTFPHYRYAPYGQEKTGRFEAWGCPNNPHFRRLMEGRIRSQAETRIDGVYLDWTQIAGGTCYCGHCREAFRAFLKDHLPTSAATRKYGTAEYASVEAPTSAADPFWMEWLEFRTHSLADFHRTLKAAARRVNPDFLIAGNVYGGFGFGPIAYDAAGHMELFGREGGHDFFYSEIQEYLDAAPHRTEDGTRISNSPVLRYLSAAAQGRPVIQYATEITPPIFPDPTEQTLNAMAQINIAEAVASQTIFREKRETPPWATQIYRFLADNEVSLVGARLHSDVAIVASVHQYLADRQSFAFSTSRVLTDAGIFHTFLVMDDLLEDDLSRYAVIILPQLPLMSVEAQRRAIDFARDGGTLVVVGSTGRYDDHNVPLESSPIAEAIGPGAEGAESISRELGEGRLHFIPLKDSENGYLIEAKAQGEFTTFGPTLADRFADIPAAYTRGAIHPDLRGELERVAKTVREAHPAASVRLSDHPYVEFSTMRNPLARQMLVHAVNYDVGIDGTVGEARGVRLRVALPVGTKAGAVRYSGSLGAFGVPAFEVVEMGGRSVVELELDRLSIYGLAVIDL
ncbi:MAG TPA: beta-galactosidase trimerization domain-containing protein, partial [Rhodothermales bacterium]